MSQKLILCSIKPGDPGFWLMTSTGSDWFLYLVRERQTGASWWFKVEDVFVSNRRTSSRWGRWCFERNLTLWRTVRERELCRGSPPGQHLLTFIWSCQRFDSEALCAPSSEVWFSSSTLSGNTRKQPTTCWKKLEAPRGRSPRFFHQSLKETSFLFWGKQRMEAESLTRLTRMLWVQFLPVVVSLLLKYLLNQKTNCNL